ncbi:FxSxx-COOH system tetratricopeptide repeat protein [Streptomyces sp. GQFP]|uniref:FxSxx-COOH system tetratricopeptide repeat protein n=1 Tax=Streptomyces sp. GQFP TaxID=2907545 RepID=UPI001F35B811|nr:FxSxx-COOH system tetratricopeptide repeat protein [Streptomyces sp. GQFP]UIX33081.1 FxSxx-COOH system tetratricopeptide repeat protein [Streptomyces sp. GQFP]
MTIGPAGPGKIVTFYSYKGGTGRTMALANVGWILASAGHRVLLVDWDLEAPGLHRYLHPLLVDPELRSSNGLINMMQAYVRTVLSPQEPAVRSTAASGGPEQSRPAASATATAGADDWLRAAADLTPYTIGLLLELPPGGRLDFLPAGRQSAAYSAAVTSFNWHTFYDQHGGGHFLQTLREEMISRYDYVLIDSRTGVSDISGICTILLPDVLVDCFTMSVQSIRGGVDAAAAVQRSEPRPIRVLPVPMRVEEAETERLEAGRDFSRSEFGPFLQRWLREEEHARYWGEIEIPYKAFYAYEEIPATVADRPLQERSLLTAFERLTEWISEGQVRRLAPLPADRRSELRTAYLRVPRTLLTRIYVSYAPPGRLWAEWAADALELIGYQVSLHNTVGPASGVLPEVAGTLNGQGRVLAMLSSEYAAQPRAAAIRLQLSGHETAGGPGLIAVPVQELAPGAAEPYLDSMAPDLSRYGAAEAFDQLVAVLGLPPGRRFQDGPAPAAGTSLPSFPGSFRSTHRLPSRNVFFTGRGPLLERLRDHFTAGPTAPVPRQVLYGISGMGKTQTALEYAHRYKSAYDVVWWIDAAQPGYIRSALADLAPHLGLESGENVRGTAQAVLRALGEGRPYKRWLLVYDNAGSPTELDGLIPEGPPGGHVLVTSRDRSWVNRAGGVEVEVFTRAESVELLHTFSPQLAAEDAEQVAHELGDLPLAVGQAAVWLSQSSMPVEMYLARLRDRPTDILDDTSLPPREYPTSAAMTWKLAVAELRERNRAAAEMLEICSFFGPAPIPMRLLYSRAVTRALTMDDDSRDELAVAQLLRALSRFGLARSDQGSETLTVHRLVQAVIRDGVGEQRWTELRGVVHRALTDANPGNPESTTDWDEYDELLPHLEPSRAAADPNPEVRRLIIDSVRYLWKRSLYGTAHDLAVRTLERWGRPGFPGGGPDDPHTLMLRTQLGNVLRSQGRLTEAYELDSDVLRRFTEAKGAEYPATLAAAGNVAADLRALGRYQEARELDRQTCEVALREFGEDHQRTLMYLNNLGMSEYLAGDRRAALDLHRSAYERQRQNQGSMKPRTLNLANNYARDLREAGELAEALRLLETTTRLYQQVLGDSHSDTLRARRNLAVALRRDGRYGEAHDIDQDIHDRLLLAHGADHYDTLAAVCNLASDFAALGEIGQALELAERALGRYQDYLGGEHPVTLVCASNMAVYLRRLGRVEEALALSGSTMEQLRRVLGESHLFTCCCALNHANDLVTAGRTQQAAVLETAVRKGLLPVLGPDHYDVIASTSNLSLSLRALNRTTEADDLHNDALERARRALGPDHPTTQAITEGIRLDSDIEPPTT